MRRNWLTITTAGGEQLSQAASGCGCSGRGARRSHGGTNCPHSSCLLLVLPSDPCNGHLLRDWEAVCRSDRGQRRVDQVRHGSRVTERVTGSLSVRVPCVRVAMSLVHRALGPHGGGGVSDDSGGHAGGCVVTKLVTRQWVQKRNSWRGRLLDACGIFYRNRWIRVWLMSIWHSAWYDARRVVLIAALAQPGLVWPGIGWGRLRQIVRW